MTSDWDCEAYGGDPEVRAAGALCFFADIGKRSCLTRNVCHQLMAGERRRVFRRINELAAGDDPTGAYAYLEREITSPGQILGGDERP